MVAADRDRPSESVFARVARLAQGWGPGGTVGLVVGATATSELSIVRGIAPGLAFLVPQVPTIGTGYALIYALGWRQHASAVIAVEERDGVRFYVEHNSPFKPTELLRTPGFRKNEPSPTDVRAGATP